MAYNFPISTNVEGTFTPTLIGGSVAGTTTYTNQNGFYVRIGNLVTVWGRVQISAATGTGDAILGGLPFTIKNNAGGNPFGPIKINAGGWTWPVGGTDVVLQGTLNSITCLIVTSGSAAGSANMQMTNAAATFNFTLSYNV